MYRETVFFLAACAVLFPPIGSSHSAGHQFGTGMTFCSHLCHSAAPFSKDLIRPCSELPLLLVLEGKATSRFFLKGKRVGFRDKKRNLLPWSLLISAWQESFYNKLSVWCLLSTESLNQKSQM